MQKSHLIPRLFILFTLFFPAHILPAQVQQKQSAIPEAYIADAEKPILLMFTATWCGPCTYMKKEVLDYGDVYKLKAQLNVADIPSHTQEMETRQHNMPLHASLYHAPWHLGLEIGTNLTNMASSDYNHYKFGYQARIYVRHFTPSYRNVFDIGISFASMGGTCTLGNVVRPAYIGIPADYGRYIFHIKRHGVYATLGLYGAYAVSTYTKQVTETTAPDMNRWDAGARGGLRINFGSGDIFVQYTRGLLNQFSGSSTGKAYNNGFSLGVSLTWGGQ